jgi:hypothetical protein
LTPVGYFALTFAFHVLGGAIDQPHPLYVKGNWLSHRLEQSPDVALSFAILMAILVPLDLGLQSLYRPGMPKDVAFGPRLFQLRSWITRSPAPLIVTVGFLLLAGYYTTTVLEVWREEIGAGGLVWPGERVFVSCLLAWGILWVADCTARPHHGTLVALVGYLFVGLLLLTQLGSRIIRE